MQLKRQRICFLKSRAACDCINIQLSHVHAALRTVKRPLHPPGGSGLRKIRIEGNPYLAGLNGLGDA